MKSHRAFDTAYSALQLGEEREKYKAHHFFLLQDYSSARSFVEQLASSNNHTTTSCSFQVAKCSAVFPFLSFALMSALASSNSRITASCRAQPPSAGLLSHQNHLR